FQLLATPNPIKINMINRQSAMVFIDQSERRAPNPSIRADIETLRHAAHEASLAGAQLAYKANNFASFKYFPNLPPQLLVCADERLATLHRAMGDKSFTQHN